MWTFFLCTIRTCIHSGYLFCMLLIFIIWGRCLSMHLCHLFLNDECSMIIVVYFIKWLFNSMRNFKFLRVHLKQNKHFGGYCAVWVTINTIGIFKTKQKRLIVGKFLYCAIIWVSDKTNNVTFNMKYQNCSYKYIPKVRYKPLEYYAICMIAFIW